MKLRDVMESSMVGDESNITVIMKVGDMMMIRRGHWYQDHMLGLDWDERDVKSVTWQGNEVFVRMKDQ